MEGVAVGRIVHYRGDVGGGECRAALIVRDWKGENGVVNLTVFPDVGNDRDADTVAYPATVSRTSIVHEDHASGPASWHWPERA